MEIIRQFKVGVRHTSYTHSLGAIANVDQQFDLKRKRIYNKNSLKQYIVSNLALNYGVLEEKHVFFNHLMTQHLGTMTK